jgi:hypothetical protein
MAKIIRTTIDPEGNVHVDLDGFIGEECRAEDRRLHESLAQLGLAQLVQTQSKKADRDDASAGFAKKVKLQAP